MENKAHKLLTLLFNLNFKEMKTREILTPKEIRFFEMNENTELYEFNGNKDDRVLPKNDFVFLTNYIEYCTTIFKSLNLMQFTRIICPVGSDSLLSIRIRLDDDFLIVRIVREGDFIAKRDYSTFKDISTPYGVINKFESIKLEKN